MNADNPRQREIKRVQDLRLKLRYALDDAPIKDWGAIKTARRDLRRVLKELRMGRLQGPQQ